MTPDTKQAITKRMFELRSNFLRLRQVDVSLDNLQLAVNILKEIDLPALAGQLNRPDYEIANITSELKQIERLTITNLFIFMLSVRDKADELHNILKAEAQDAEA